MVRGWFVVMTGTLVFLIIGGIGVAILALALIGGELAGFFDAGFDGAVSTEAIAGFVGVFGFGAATTTALVGAEDAGTLVLASGVGLAAAIPATFLIARLSRAAHDMATDDTPQRSDLIGTTGVVISPIPAGGYGEVRLQLGGHRLKLNARADEPMALGAPVLVVEAPSDTSVVVVDMPGAHFPVTGPHP
jgi:membrane protein implicated in regulation of membrane protease activity